MSQEELLEKLMDLFSVKKNSVISFWFIETYKVADGLKVPEGYTLYESKNLDGCKWSCYIKKEVKGIFSKSYWQK